MILRFNKGLLRFLIWDKEAMLKHRLFLCLKNDKIKLKFSRKEKR